MSPLDLVRAFHLGTMDPSEEAMDAALGLPLRKPILGIHEDPDLALRHPGESFADLPTPYAIARGLFEALALNADDVLFDLGCGTGRVVLYGAAVTPARLRGIEIVESRVEVGQAAVRSSGFDRVTIDSGSVMDHDLSGASVFYMCRPFGDETEAKVVERLHAEARYRPIRVVTHRVRPGRLDPSILEPISTGTLTIYRSRG